MTTTPTPQVVNSYLAQLETALRGVEPAVRDEIVAGIREELDGLDASAAATRIEELGDPEFIAAGARAATPVSRQFAAGRGWTIVAALLVMIGGAVIPFLGAIAGLVLVALSPAWTRRQKLIAIIAPFAAALLIAIATMLVTRQSAGVTPAGVEESQSLLLPTFADVVWGGASGLIALWFVDGIWLLIAAHRNAIQFERIGA